MADTNPMDLGSKRADDLDSALALAQSIDPSWTYENIGDHIYDDHTLLKMRPDGRYVMIDLLAVEPKFRGQGRGRRAVQVAEETARMLGLGAIGVLTVEPDFFAHLGFLPITILPQLARGRDVTVMIKELDDVSNS